LLVLVTIVDGFDVFLKAYLDAQAQILRSNAVHKPRVMSEGRDNPPPPYDDDTVSGTLPSCTCLLISECIQYRNIPELAAMYG
jgi:hypothetical protein